MAPVGWVQVHASRPEMRASKSEVFRPCEWKLTFFHVFGLFSIQEYARQLDLLPRAP